MKWEHALSAALGALVGVGAALWFADEPAVGSAPRIDATAGLDTSVLVEELRAIRELLDEPDLQRPDSVVSDRREIGGAVLADSAELVEALDRLAAELAQEPLWGNASLRSEPEEDAPREVRPADYEEVRGVIHELDADVNATVPEFFGLSPREIYRRFGTPTRIGNSADRVRWFYDDPGGGQLQITFMDGYVAWFTRRDP